MRREDYLGQECVKGFVKWLRLRAEGEPFEHSFRMARERRHWRCKSLWEAYERYSWRGRDFKANQKDLDPLRDKIRAAAKADDNGRFVDAACGILQWGGVTRSNVPALKALGRDALPTFLEAACLLDPAHADTSRLGEVRCMNSGWTKVYALMLDGFPIYDGRVGAALGYLVRRYCEVQELALVPESLAFRWLPGRGDQIRNPSCGALRLPRLSYSGPGATAWAVCNVQAAWILGQVCDAGPFGNLPACRRLRALEAALFMIGYNLPRGR